MNIYNTENLPIQETIQETPQIKPYVYKLTHKETGQFYIGYREGNKKPALEDLPIYQTSSNLVKELGFDNFISEIIKEFDNTNENSAGDLAFIFEQNLIKENWENSLLLNQHYRCPKDNTKRFKAKKGKEAFNYGKTWEELYGEEQAKIRKEKLRERMSGKNNPSFNNPNASKYLKPYSDSRKGKSAIEYFGKEKAKEIKEKQVLGLTGLKKTQEAKNNISKSLKGKPKSDAHRKIITENNRKRALIPETEETRKKKSESHKGIGKGKTWEEIYGIEKAEEMRRKRKITGRKKKF